MQHQLSGTLKLCKLDDIVTFFLALAKGRKRKPATLRMRNLQSCKIVFLGKNRGQRRANKHNFLWGINNQAKSIVQVWQLAATCVCVCGGGEGCIYGICNNVCMARFRLKIMLCLPTVSTKNSSENFFGPQ